MTSLSRGVTEEFWKYVCEVHYKVPNQNSIFYSIGFKSNTENFYELRSSTFKGCSGKDITTVENGSSKIIILEGFFDYLSFLVLYPKHKSDFLIMNSAIMLEKAIQYLRNKNYIEIQLILDNDEAGNYATKNFMIHFSKAKDCRSILNGKNDLNDFLVSFVKRNYK